VGDRTMENAFIRLYKAMLWIRNHFVPYPDSILQVVPDPTDKTRQSEK
jgi:hypothetical protein